ncbi:MAG: hypothetical protein LBL51_02320 [Synergistaceae bacterium]|jgi:high-affinity Fe2+/Pb2+ permease|nr:hypothetical protein [Synergistaceae bacterium]
MKRKFKIALTAISVVYADVLVAASGLWMPWNEEAALYAVYGASAGVCAAITTGMLVVWLTRKDRS